MVFTKLRRARHEPPAADDAAWAEIAQLTAENGAADTAARARRVLALRHEVGRRLLEGGAPGDSPDFGAPDFSVLPADAIVPELAADRLTAAALRGAMLRHGCLLVRGLIPREDAERLVEGIDRAYAAREAADTGAGRDGWYEPFECDPRFGLALERGVAASGAGLLAVDSPLVLLDVLATFERAGVRALAGEYLQEPYLLSINKSLLRRVRPDLYDEVAKLHRVEAGRKPSGWHQDGAFLTDVRALNVWLALTRCGDVAPGMDVVPVRLDRIAPTGTEGSLYEWSVSQEIAEEWGGKKGIVRPVFEPGDALLFDELLLHATAAEPDMPETRYAVESWFFGRSGFPPRYAPLAF